MFKAGDTKEGRKMLQQRFRLCKELTSTEDVTQLAYWVQVGGGIRVQGFRCLGF
jgi:hypothetical protein